MTDSSNTSNIEALSETRENRGNNVAKSILENLGDYLTFSSPTGERFVSLTVNSHTETWAIESLELADIIGHRAFEEQGLVVSPHTIKLVQRHLAAEARSGPVNKVFLRIAGDLNGLFVDLGNHEGSAVHITPERVQIVANSDVKFIRTPGMGSLPEPDLDGTINEAQALLKLEGDTWTLFVGALLASFHPSGPYPIVYLSGPHGSGKSFRCEILRRCIDPMDPLLVSLPRRPDHLWVAARLQHVLAFDNISEVPTWLAIRRGAFDRNTPCPQSQNSKCTEFWCQAKVNCAPPPTQGGVGRFGRYGR